MKQGTKTFMSRAVRPLSVSLAMTFFLRKITPSMTMRNTGMVAIMTAVMWLYMMMKRAYRFSIAMVVISSI